jgi:A/G-specific adenine glycosylase
LQIYSFIFIYNHSPSFFCLFSYLCGAIQAVCYLNFKKIYPAQSVMKPTSSRPDLAADLGAWYDRHSRDLPWRCTRDPYLIWLSEIILQQTRVAQGRDYYLRFAAAYPTVADLAAAPADEVMKLWQGLGYYSRARNLMAAARQVMEEFGGRFPATARDLARLKGVGPYTAAAIASFAFDEPVAVVDGNVYRVLARLFDVETPIDSTAGARLFRALADDLLDRAHPARHNQAMMEMGALQCTPSAPDCTTCPVADRCAALAAGTVALRPVKQQRLKVRTRFLHYFIIEHDGQFFVHRREEGDIWAGLYEFVLAERDASTPVEALLEDLLTPEALSAVTRVTPILLQEKQRLTHQLLQADAYLVSTARLLSPRDFRSELPQYFTVSARNWLNFAVPKLISTINQQLFTQISCTDAPKL